MMRIAVVKGTLRIPPTYFAIEHTKLLSRSHNIRTFTLVADIQDLAVQSSGLQIADFVPFRGRPFQFRERLMPLFLKQMEHEIGRFRPDVIHQHFATWSLPAVTAAKRWQVPLIVTLHGADVGAALRVPSATRTSAKPMLHWHQWNVTRAFESAAVLLAVSNHLAGEAIRAGADPARVKVHYQGVDTDYFTPTTLRESRESEHGPEVAFVGAFTRQKGIPDLLEASISIARTHPHKLRLVGEGPLKDMVENAARDYGHIDLVGTLDKEGVRNVLRRASALVLPTQRTDGRQEAAGLVLLEAQACGVPVVAYDSGGTREMLIDGETGLLAEEFNRKELADKLKEVLFASPVAAADMARNARDFVVSQRSIAVGAHRLEEHYRELTG